MDRAFAHGIDGWKVDNGERQLPDTVLTAAKLKTKHEYGEAYYRAYYQYVAERTLGRGSAETQLARLLQHRS